VSVDIQDTVTELYDVLRNCKVLIPDLGRIPIEEALPIMTDEWIEAGEDAEATLCDVRDALNIVFKTLKEIKE